MNDTLTCSRCGVCCEKGGAVLHKEDLALVKNGILPLSKLITLRQGELAYDPVRLGAAELTPLNAEVIKIAGKNIDEGKWACIFLDGENTCTIYEHRPLQCRAFFCKDTSELEKIYEQGRVSRKDILANAPAGWFELAEIHEEKCALNVLIPLMERALGDMEAVNTLLEIVNYDTAFRTLCCERADVSHDELNCLLGRPVAVFLASFGLGFVNKGSDTVLEKIGINMYARNLHTQ